MKNTENNIEKKLKKLDDILSVIMFVFYVAAYVFYKNHNDFMAKVLGGVGVDLLIFISVIYGIMIYKKRKK